MFSEWNQTQPFNYLQNKPDFNQVCEVISMEVMGSKLAAGLTSQQIYFCHRTWGLLLEASVQRAAEAFLASVILLRKINGHGDEGFEKFDSEIKVGFDSYIMGRLATRLIGTNPRSEEEVERSPTVEASSKEISRPALDVEFIDGPDMSVKVSSTVKVLAAAKSKDEGESEDDKDEEEDDDDDEDDDNEEDLGEEEGDEDVSSEDGGEENVEGNGAGGAGEEDEDDDDDDEDGNDNNEKAGSDEDEEDEDDEEEVVEEEDDHGEGDEEEDDDDGEDEDGKEDEDDEDEESLQPPKKRKK